MNSGASAAFSNLSTILVTNIETNPAPSIKNSEQQNKPPASREITSLLPENINHINNETIEINNQNNKCCPPCIIL